MEYHRPKGGLGTSGTLGQVSMLDKSAVLGSPLVMMLVSPVKEMMGIPGQKKPFCFQQFYSSCAKNVLLPSCHKTGGNLYI